jgi:hypothetical protein
MRVGRNRVTGADMHRVLHSAIKFSNQTRRATFIVRVPTKNDFFNILFDKTAFACNLASLLLPHLPNVFPMKKRSRTTKSKLRNRSPSKKFSRNWLDRMELNIGEFMMISSGLSCCTCKDDFDTCWSHEQSIQDRCDCYGDYLDCCNNADGCTCDSSPSQNCGQKASCPIWGPDPNANNDYSTAWVCCPGMGDYSG